MGNHQHSNTNHSTGPSHHYILPDSLAIKTGGALLALTVLTVAISYVHFGQWNFIIGMLVATIKAGLVAGIFMNLVKDHRSNLIIFLMGFFFLAIFILLTVTDIWHRPEKFTNNQPLFKQVEGAPQESKFKNPWEPSPDLVAHGKAIFANNCVSCHGAEGGGDGAAAANLNPKPRNFHADAGWKNGRKPSQIFKTLKEGIGGGAMASYESVLPNPEDRWALSHYVASLGPNVLEDSADDKKAAEVAMASSKPKSSLRIEDAIERVIEDQSAVAGSSSDESVYIKRLNSGTLPVR